MKRIRLTMRSLLVLLLLPAFSLTYSQITVTGKASSATDNNSLPGVNVVVKGTTTGAITDLDGNYSIEVPDAKATLVFSYVGFLAEEVIVGSQTTIDISLAEDITSLDEIVVIGYGTRKKSNVTGAVASVADNYLEQQPGGDVVKALQGSVSGVVVTNSGSLGAGSKIEIRGMGTINNNNPLWVVDGIYGAPAPNSNQIESIQVLKDAASTAIYGSAGANGVILVTTKSGKKNRPVSVDLNIRAGFVAPNAKQNILYDPIKIGELIQLEQVNSGSSNPRHVHFDFTGETPVLNDYLWPNGGVEGEVDHSTYDQESNPITQPNRAGTDWLDEVYQNGMIKDYNLGITGGSEKTIYGIHLNYLDENGQVIHSNLKQYGARVNVDTDVKKWLRIGQRISYQRRQFNGNGGGNSQEGLFHSITEVSPILPKYDVAENLAGPIVGGTGAKATPFASLTRGARSERMRTQLYGNLYAELKPIKGVTFKTLFGYNTNNYHNITPRLKAPEHPTGATSNILMEWSGHGGGWNWSNTLNYQNTFRNHHIDVLLGTESGYGYSRNLDGTKAGYFTDNPNYMVLDAGETINDLSGTKSEGSRFDVFGRIHYNYLSKYLIDFTGRRDGSSRLDEDNRYSFFPSIAVGWKISEESFMAGTKSWLNHLKLRGSWGESGNNRIGAYNSYWQYGGAPGESFYAITGSDNTVEEGFHLTAFGYPVPWEKNTSTNIGLDLTVWGGLSLNVDLWQRLTTDMHYPLQRPQVVGQADLPSVNIGEMENKGVDIVIDYKGNTLGQELSYFISLNFSMYKNKVIKLNDQVDEILLGGGIRDQIYTQTEAGRSFPEFYGYKIDGIFQTDEEADAWPENGNYNEAGNLRFVDVNGDTVITPEDRTYIGNPHPDFTTGLNLGVEYKGIDLAATFYASVGHDIVNYTRRFTDFGMFDGPGSPERLYESWGSPYLNGNNEAATLPKASNSEAAEQWASDMYVEDGSYLRLQNIQLGYSLPSAWLDQVNINKARIYFMATNLFTLTNYTGLNPEVINASTNSQQNSQMNRGVDVSNFPAIRQFMFGLNLTF